MWSCCVESLKALLEDDQPGYGCVLAHSMGLGKTLQVVALIHTLLTHRAICGKLRTVLIIVPVNVAYNWQREFAKWVPWEKKVDVTVLGESGSSMVSRTRELQQWYSEGGVMIIGFDMYRNLSAGRRLEPATLKQQVFQQLVDPGPDVVVVDEAHTLRNSKSNITLALQRIGTKRRIALTGSPLQNNLMEYHTMVDFVRENHLGPNPSPRFSPRAPCRRILGVAAGSRAEFQNRFENPIKNGQCLDSTAYDIKLMKSRAHILHSLVATFVQRMDYTVLMKDLPHKTEFVLVIKTTQLQRRLYKAFIERRRKEVGSSSAGVFAAFQWLMNVWNHPNILFRAAEARTEREEQIRLRREKAGALASTGLVKGVAPAGRHSRPLVVL
jgi:transcriptional regulator ATRX